MEYHKLSYRKAPDAVSVSPRMLSWIVFDGVLSHYAFDEPSLKVSSEKDGIYPVVVCGCDYIACGGMYVSIRIEGEDIIWEKFWQGQCSGEPKPDDEFSEFALFHNYVKEKNIIVKPPLRFKLSEYRALAEEIEKDVKSSPVRSVYSKNWYDEAVEKYKSGDTFRM